MAPRSRGGKHSFGVCVAIVPEERGGGGSSGIGKTTIAAMVCVKSEVRARFHRGIAWLDMGKQKGELTLEQYCKYLSEVCQQVGLRAGDLKLSPFVRSPCDDEAVSNIRMRNHMISARTSMAKLLASSTRGRNHAEQPNVLVVLDGVREESDVEWFRFSQHGSNEKICDVLLTTRLTKIRVAKNIPVPLLEEDEGVRLLLTESNLSPDHPMKGNPHAYDLVTHCLLHPLTIKTVGRWMGLKRMTGGGGKGVEEILEEVCLLVNAFGDSKTEEGSHVNILFAILSMAISPLVKGEHTKIVKLCFAAFVRVFCNEPYLPSIPLETAEELFVEVLECSKSWLKKDALYQSHGFQATKLVPEVLGALGIFKVTKCRSKNTDSEVESSAQIDHDLFRSFGEHICTSDVDMIHLVKHAEVNWNQAYVKSYTERKADIFWDDYQPDHSHKYALRNMPGHMLQAEMYDDIESLLGDENFIRGRLWCLGWVEGTRANVKDIEALHARRLKRNDSSSLFRLYERLEAVLKAEVSGENIGPQGCCSSLEAGRCLHEISMSLAKIGYWKEAANYCDSCKDFVSNHMGSVELVAALSYNSGMLHLEMNELNVAERKIEECIRIRAKISGTESVAYVKALCLLGDILSMMSDYSAAETCFQKCVTTLRLKSTRYRLELGVVLYKMGRNYHRKGGSLEDAFHCYEQSLEFERQELGPKHIFLSSINRHMADILLRKGDTRQADHTFREALAIMKEMSPMSVEVKSEMFTIEGALQSLQGHSDECIRVYEDSLKLLQCHAPRKIMKIIRLKSLLAAEYESKRDHASSKKLYEESLEGTIEVLGSMHLVVAKTMVNLSNVNRVLGKMESAKEYLDEAARIRKSRLGDCKQVATTLALVGSLAKDMGDFQKAESKYENALSILRSVNGDTDESVSNILKKLGDLMDARNMYDEAMKYYLECLEIRKAIFGIQHDSVAGTLYSMGFTKHNQRDYKRAMLFFEKSAKIAVELHGDVHQLVGDAYNMMGFTEAKRTNLDKALGKLANALWVRQQTGDRLTESETLANIGNVYREKEQFELSVENYDNCLSIRVAELGRDNERVAETLVLLGSVKSDMALHEESLKLYKEAMQIYSSVNGSTHNTVACVLEKIGMMEFRAGNFHRGQKNLEKFISMCRTNQKGGNAINALFVLGNIFQFIQSPDEAMQAWGEARDEMNKIGDDGKPGRAGMRLVLDSLLKQ